MFSHPSLDKGPANLAILEKWEERLSEQRLVESFCKEWDFWYLTLSHVLFVCMYVCVEAWLRLHKGLEYWEQSRPVDLKALRSKCGMIVCSEILHLTAAEGAVHIVFHVNSTSKGVLCCSGRWPWVGSQNSITPELLQDSRKQDELLGWEKNGQVA